MIQHCGVVHQDVNPAELFYHPGKDVYKRQGWYCTPCEAYWQERELQDGKCPDCGRPVELIAEEAYFFRMSRYAGRLLEHIETHPEFILPRCV